MAIYIGTTKLQSSSNLHVSTTEIKNIHIDNDLVWQSYVPPVVLFGTNQGTDDARYNQGLFDPNLAGGNLFELYSELIIHIMQPSMDNYYGIAEIAVYNYNTVYSGSEGSSVSLNLSGNNTSFNVSMAVSGAMGEPRVTYVLGIPITGDSNILYDGAPSNNIVFNSKGYVEFELTTDDDRVLFASGGNVLENGVSVGAIYGSQQQTIYEGMYNVVKIIGVI